jgi:hypothetical protein
MMGIDATEHDFTRFEHLAGGETYYCMADEVYDVCRCGDEAYGSGHNEWCWDEYQENRGRYESEQYWLDKRGM